MNKFHTVITQTYYFGWFPEYHKDVDPSTKSYVGHLVGTNDVVNDEISPGQDMTVKLSSSGETDLFMMYQKTEGITLEIDSDYAATFNNHVVIVEQSEDGADSFVKASLAPGDMYTQKVWNGGTLVVQVCSITSGTPDVAKVISFVDGKTHESCYATEGECVDTDKKFIVNYKLKNCKWVDFNPARRCKKGGVSSMCPVRCGTCGYENCRDGKKRFLQLESNNELKGCAWVRGTSSLIEERCNLPGVREICRRTCGHCEHSIFG